MALPDSLKDEESAGVLLPVLTKATNEDPAARQQSVEEFWFELSALREIVAEGELTTVVTSIHETPQPHVSRGYTPIVPARADFEEAREPTPVSVRPAYAAVASAAAGAAPIAINIREPVVARTSPYIDRVTRDTKATEAVKPKRRRLRRVLTFV